MATEPYLSIVVPSRNDNHGGDLLRRMQMFVTALLEQCRRHQLPAELIVVEWNPPADRPRLAEALRWPREPGPCAVRIVEVPAALHRRYKNAEGLALYQMIAKNVGIRRARGRFVLATNLDILFSDELVRFVAGRQLSEDRMYRIDRHDAMAGVPDAPVEEQLEWCRSHLIRVNAAGGTSSVTPEGGFTFEREDIAAENSGITLGAGWFARELDGKMPFRWIENHAEIVVASPGGGLSIDMEPGPGVQAGPTTLEVLDDKASILFTARLGGRRMVKIPVPRGEGLPVRLRLRFQGEVRRVEGEPRPLHARVFRCAVSGSGSTGGSGLSERMRWRLRSSLARGSRLAETWPDFLHLTACGDFTMLARERWLDLRGYPEFDMFAIHLDSLFCWAAHYGGAKEYVLKEPMRVYHIEHEIGSGWTPEGEEKLFERMKKSSIPCLEQADMLRWAFDMSRLNAPMIFNREDWGMAAYDLKVTCPIESV